MPTVIPLQQCIARPSDGEQIYYLTKHLLNVKKNGTALLDKTDPVLHKLIALAGACHDIFKAQIGWQAYIKNKDKKKGPSHAPPGAFLFSYLAYNMLGRMNAWDNYKVFWLWLIRDIADHHGMLKNLSKNYWIISINDKNIDIKSIELFFQKEFEELSDIKINKQLLDIWRREKIDDYVDHVMDYLDLSYKEYNPLDLMKELQLWRQLTTCLIAGDRFDVTETTDLWIREKEYKNNNVLLDRYCTDNSDSPLSVIRQKAQEDILKQLELKPEGRFYTLEMPTGYGKTITSLRIATWFGLNKGIRKIIYVAPYISILEQTSNVIEKAIKITPLEHHSLAVLDNAGSEEIDQPEDYSNFKNQLITESWAHKVICTSFQQLAKAIFPGRAQDVLRRSFLKDSIVIIDEPQVFKPEGWNVFLCGLEALAAQYNLTVVFLSATMPTFEYGLTIKPLILSVKSETNIERYRIKNINELMGEKEISSYLKNNETQNNGTILNTIEDAYKVYTELIDDKKIDVTLVHGLMIPLHKKVEISKIQKRLEENNKKPYYVVSTQVLEAGVDVSFGHVVRALPIMPSIIQAAGRVNRHFESEQGGLLSVIPFFRGKEKNTRNSIYRPTLQKITDKLLSEKETWYESEVTTLIDRYYTEMFRENTYEACKEGIKQAYEGRWSKLAEFSPFGEDYFRLPLFIPWQVKDEDKNILPKNFLLLQDKFKIYNPFDLYDCYLDREYMTNFNFEERKKFLVLFYYYILNVPVKTALALVGKEEYLQNRIPILLDTEAYEEKTGLTRHFINGSDNII